MSNELLQTLVMALQQQKQLIDWSYQYLTFPNDEVKDDYEHQIFDIAMTQQHAKMLIHTNSKGNTL